jgi:hypothetical protein
MAPVEEEERGTSKMKGIWKSPARAVTRTSHGKLAKSDEVMPNRLVSPAPNMSPVLLPKLEMDMRAAYSVASMPCETSQSELNHVV